MRLILLHNPTAGDEDHSRDALERQLRGAGHDIVYRSTKEHGWEEVLHETADVMVIAGGDGTVEKVVTALDRSSIPIAILPMGSANNIATALGFGGGDPASLIASWDEAERVRFDVWEVAGHWGRGRFLEAFGGGVFANVLKRAEALPGESGGDDKVDRGLGLIRRELERIEPETWELEIDGQRLREELLSVEVMNISRLGPQLELAPDADPGDGLLDVVLLLPENRDALIAHVDAHLEDAPGPISGLEVIRGSRVVVTAPAGSRLHTDDEFPPLSSVRHRSAVYPADVVIDVLVPPGADS